MDAGLTRGFALGFAAVAILTAGLAWRAGWLSAPVPGGPPAVATLPKAPQSAPQSAPPAAPSKPSETPAAAAPTSPKAEAKPQPPAEKGAFDVVRVEPSGDIVVAGRCVADCTVELTANGRVQDKAKADGAGNFAMTPPPLAPGDHQLGLKVTRPDGAVALSEQTVTVSVPKAPSKEVVVVLNEPDAPSKVLQRPGQAPAAPAPSSGQAEVARRDPPAAPGAAKTPGDKTSGSKTPAQSVAALSLGAVDAERGRFFVQGTAPSGARLRVYLNNALIAEPVAGADERWSVRVERGLAPGRYVARVDHVGPDGKVLARAEQGFAYEAEIAAAPRREPAPRPEAKTAERSQPTPSTPEQKPAAPALAEPKRAEAPVAAPAGETPSAPDTARTGAKLSAAEPPAATAIPPDAGAGPNSPQPSASASAPAAASQTDAPRAPDAANPVVSSIDTAQVARGDSLWRISRKTYGRGVRYTAIFTANDDQIRNPDLIYPGQVLVLPADKAEAPER